MIGNTKLYIAPKTHGAPLMGECSPVMGGWWTDFVNAVKKGAGTGIDLYTQYQTGQITKEQYNALLKAQEEQQKTTASLTKYAVVGAIGLAAILLLSKGK